MRIRSHLLLLAFGVILPVAAFSIFLTTLLVDREQRTFAEGAIERLRSTMIAIDAQVQGQIMVLNALASVRELERGALDAFATEARRVLDSQPAWLNVILAAPDGRQIVNVTLPDTVDDHPYLVERDLAKRTAASRAPAVGSIVTRPGDRRGVNLATPVMHGGEVRYVLVAFVKPELFQTLIDRQRIGPGWVSGIVDANGRFIARVPPPPREIAGTPFLDAVAKSPEGWYRGRTTEGYDSYTAHITSSLTHWSIGLGIPASEVLAGARRTAWLMGTGTVASLVLAAFLALWLGRRVAWPVARIAEGASRIASGVPVDTRGLERVAEIRTVAVALNEAADAIRERETLVAREQQALREADRAKDQFIAMISHELRNPLAALTSASHLLELLAPDDPRTMRARAVIARQTSHMARLVEDLLDTSRVVMGKAHLHPEVFNLADAASAVIQTMRASGRLDDHAVTLEGSAAWVSADRSRVEQVISNLLDNALKFSPAGSTVRIDVSKEDAHAKIAVADEGAGMTPEMMERAFGLFVQSEQGLARRSGGMGIGLALVKRLTELQGGTVTVASEGEGRGTVFTVCLPAVPEPNTTPDLSIQTIPIAPCRVLVVDDNEDMRQTTAASLALHGYDVCEAADGASAFDLAKDVVPDAAVIDIGLPRIDGYELARRLRSDGVTRDIALVALTGYGQAGDKRNAQAAGFDAHLTKPVEPEVLLKTLSTVCARRARARAPAP